MDLDKITLLIEELREEIHKLVHSKGLLDEKVLKKSRELDKLLIEYHKLKKE